MKIRLLEVPYHFGQEGLDEGKGPIRYIQAGAADLLARRGCEVTVEPIRRREPFRDARSAMIDVNRQLFQGIRTALEDGCFPLVLAGNCHNCLGILGGFDHRQTGIVWFDAHGDFNTPETTLTGSIDGMALASAAGHCNQDFWQPSGDATPIPEAHILLVGARNLDPEERVRLGCSSLRIIPEKETPGALIPALDTLKSQVNDIYLHIDIDVLDPQESPGNWGNSPGGMSLDQLARSLRLVAGRLPIRAAVLTCYNPDCDPDGQTLRAGLHVLEVLTDALTRSGGTHTQ